MLFDSSKNKCILTILIVLVHLPSSYSALFRKTKVSHVTLQTALKELLEKKLIERVENKGFGIQYSITEKGRLVLRRMKYLANI